jgi:hypothetical protein
LAQLLLIFVSGKRNEKNPGCPFDGGGGCLLFRIRSDGFYSISAREWHTAAAEDKTRPGTG